MTDKAIKAASLEVRRSLSDSTLSCVSEDFCMVGSGSCPCADRAAQAAITAYEAAKEAAIEKAGDEYDKMRAEYRQFDAALGGALSGVILGKKSQAPSTAYPQNVPHMAPEGLVHVDEYMYLDGDIDLDHIQDWYMN